MPQVIVILAGRATPIIRREKGQNLYGVPVYGNKISIEILPVFIMRRGKAISGRSYKMIQANRIRGRLFVA